MKESCLFWKSGCGGGWRQVVAGIVLKHNYPLIGKAAAAAAAAGTAGGFLKEMNWIERNYLLIGKVAAAVAVGRFIKEMYWVKEKLSID